MIFGFDVVTIGDEWIEGHLLWIRPELRQRGLAGLYFEAVVDLARSLGLKGFRFLSTLPYWRSSTLLHQETYLVQENGVTVTEYWKEA